MTEAIIVDDKPINAQTLELLLTEYCPSITVTGTAGSVDEAYALIAEKHPRIVFLDIEMPTGSGFDLLHKFSKVPFEVIFTTAYSDYAIDAFKENALDYLLKPISIPDLQQAVAKAENQIKLKEINQQLSRYLDPLRSLLPAKIGLPTQDGLLFINQEEIVRCEASGSYSRLYINNDKKIMVSLLLREVEEMLFGCNFIRIHNSHIVNTRFVTQYVRGRGGTAIMEDGSEVEVAASRKNDFLEAMKRRYPG